MAPRFFGESARQTTGLALVDLDGDGDMDLLESAFNQPNQMRFFESNGTYGASVDLNSSNTPTHALAAGDVDGDGDVDVVFGNDATEKDALWLNDGAGGFVSGEKITAYQPVSQIPPGYLLRMPFDGITSEELRTDGSGNEFNATHIFGLGTNVLPYPSRHGRANNAVLIKGNATGRIEWQNGADMVPIFNGTDDLSVSFWMKPMGTDGTGNSKTVLSYKPAGDTNEPEYSIEAGDLAAAGNGRVIGKWTNTNYNALQSNATHSMDYGQWNHVVYVHAGGET